MAFVVRNKWDTAIVYDDPTKVEWKVKMIEVND